MFSRNKVLNFFVKINLVPSKTFQEICMMISMPKYCCDVIGFPNKEYMILPYCQSNRNLGFALFSLIVPYVVVIPDNSSGNSGSIVKARNAFIRLDYRIL